MAGLSGVLGLGLGPAAAAAGGDPLSPELGAGLLAWVALLSAAEVLAHALLILVLLRSAGARAGLGVSYHVLMVSMCANALTPFRAGFPIRIYLYRRLFGLDLATGTALVAVESVIVAGVPAAVAGIGVAALYPRAGWYGPAAAGIVAGTVLLSPWLYRRLWPHRLFDFTGPGAAQARWRRLGRRLTVFLRGVADAMSATPIRVLLLGGLLILGTVIAQSARLDAVLAALGQGVGIVAATTAFCVSFTLGMLSMLPLGLGVRDASLAWLLADAGVGASAVASAVVAQRLFAPGMYIALGIVSASALGVRGWLRARVALEGPDARSGGDRGGDAPR